MREGCKEVILIVFIRNRLFLNESYNSVYGSLIQIAGKSLNNIKCVENNLKYLYNIY